MCVHFYICLGDVFIPKLSHTEYFSFLKIECMEFHVSNYVFHVTIVSVCRTILSYFIHCIPYYWAFRLFPGFCHYYKHFDKRSSRFTWPTLAKPLDPSLNLNFSETRSLMPQLGRPGPKLPGLLPRGLITTGFQCQLSC